MSPHPKPVFMGFWMWTWGKCVGDCDGVQVKQGIRCCGCWVDSHQLVPLISAMGSCCCFDCITERLPALAYWPWKFVYWSSGLITFIFTSLGLSGHTHLLARCSMFASLDLILYEEGFKMSSPGTIILQKRLVTTDDHLSTWKKYNVRLVKVLASTRLLWKSFRFIILGNFSEATHQLYLVATWIKQIHISPTEGKWGCGGHLLISKVCGCVAIELHCGALQLQPLGTFAGVEFSLQDVGHPVTLGSGVAATQAHLQRSTQPIGSRIWTSFLEVFPAVNQTRTIQGSHEWWRGVNF